MTSTTYNADIKDISKRMYITGVAIVAGVITAFISICMVFRYLSFGSPNFDMGLFFADVSLYEDDGQNVKYK